MIPPTKMPNKILPITIIAQFIKIWDKNSNYIGKAYDIFDIYYKVTIKQSQFHVLFIILTKTWYLLKYTTR